MMYFSAQQKAINNSTIIKKVKYKMTFEDIMAIFKRKETDIESFLYSR